MEMTDFLLMVGGALFAMFISGIVNYGKREWIGLTDEELREFDVDPIEAKLMIAKLKEKNHANGNT
jgi:hypothetical protein